MPIFDDEKPGEKATPVTSPLKDKPSTTTAPANTGSAPSRQSIKLSAKEQLMQEHLSPWNDYKPAKGTEDQYHLLVEQVVIKDLDFKSNPHVATINRQSFQQFYLNHFGLGLTIHKILHDPQPDLTQSLIDKAEEMRQTGKTV